MIIKGHRVEITKAYSIWEQGVGYSLQPWGGNTLYYEGESTPIDIELDTGYAVGKSIAGDLRIYPGSYDLQEAIDIGIARLLESQLEGSG